ncbi:ferredoxin [Amycolatopsis sp. A1MSW2902]|uniref:ferredoxin n=1 Tax=Amycolatopsis sp. A1MSW2902 TaxID=687413 RepID=UPI00307F049D
MVVDTDRCVGAGQCVLMEPAVFGQDETDGTVILLVAEPAEDQLDMVRRAVRTCPSEAILLPEPPTEHRD